MAAVLYASEPVELGDVSLEIGQVAASATNCNVCGGASFVERGNRGNAICQTCRSDVRTRLMWLFLNLDGFLRPGLRVLHFAPEMGLAERLSEILGDGYDPVDLEPDRFDYVPNIRRIDLVKDSPNLPFHKYDAIIHSHVMEHVPCNVTAVLYHLHRAIKVNGIHLCCIPIGRGRGYSEDLSPIGPEEAIVRFGQDDHVRCFGENDISRTLGMIFKIPVEYNLLAYFEEKVLIRHGISPITWKGWSPNSILRLRKDDILLS